MVYFKGRGKAEKYKKKVLTNQKLSNVNKNQKSFDVNKHIDLKLVIEAEAGSQAPAEVGFIKPKRKVSKVFIHCSADSNPQNDDIDIIRQWHIERGFGKEYKYQDKVGYHYFIKKDGTLQSGRNIELTPAAQKGHNTGSIAICLHGGGGTPPVNDFTNAQYDTLKNLCKSINEAYNGNITFHGHREVSNKACPVFDYKKVLKLNENGKTGL